MVLSLTVVLVVAAAWPTVRPVREVRVTQAVFDRAQELVVGASSASIRSVPTVQAAGWLEADPYITAVPALADGIVEAVHVLEGDFVEAGQVVATLVKDDARLMLQRAVAQEMASQSRLALAEAEFDAAQSDWDRPVELERRIAAAKARVAEAEGERHRLPSLIDAARAMLVGYEEERKRIEEAFGNEAATELELVIAGQRAVAQRARIAALESERDILDAGIRASRAEADAAEEEYELRVVDRLRLRSARAGLGLARAEAEHSSAVRAEAELRLDRMDIRSPSPGYVQRRLKSPGDKAVLMMDDPASAQIVHVYDPGKLQVRVDVPLADAAHITLGQACEVIVEILPDTTFAGRVLRIMHEADLQKNTLQVKVAVENPSLLLKPEMLTRVRFLGSGRGSGDRSQIGSEASRVRVPLAALDATSGVGQVWVVSDRRASRGTANPVDVSVLERDAGWATVSGQIQPGALLITNYDGLRAKQTVSIVPEPDPASEVAS